MSSTAAEHPLSVSLAISDFEDEDLFGECNVRVHGVVGGQEFCLPVHNAFLILTDAQQARVNGSPAQVRRPQGQGGRGNQVAVSVRTNGAKQ